MIFIFANILIVDDSILYIRTMTIILENERYNVFASYDGVEIFEIVEGKKIDVILLDVVLPETSGFELLKKLQDNEDTKDIPVIMVTGLTDPKNVKRALDMGALDYIKKPSEPIELIARIHSALRLKTKQDLLKEYAVRDGLTKLYNRSYIDKILHTIMLKIEQYEKGISFAMLDCDFFKRINDQYGHVSGDTVLASVANALFKSVKSTDIAGRYGGEEFCIILPNTSLQEGFIVCERIRNNMRKIKYFFNEDETHVTISIGLSHMKTGDHNNVLGFICEADTALYAAKNKGRNRVEFYKK